LATVIAALKRWRNTCGRLGDESLLATLDGSARPLNPQEIQELERKILDEK